MSEIPLEKQIKGPNGKIHHIDDIYPLKELVEMLKPEINVTYNRVHQWANKRKTTEFPEPVRKISRFNFYDLAEVREWCVLWMRATKNMEQNNNGRLFGNG